MSRRIAPLATALLAALALAPALGAAQSTGQGSTTYYMPYEKQFWSYAGASIGRTDWDFSCGLGGCDDRSTGFKLHAGGRLNNVIGLEAAYFHLGEGSLAPGVDVRAQGINLSVLAGVPIGQSASINGKVGGVYGWTRVTGPFGGREDGLGLSYGANATVGLTRNLDLRFDWDRYRLDFAQGDDRVNQYSIGLQYKF